MAGKVCTDIEALYAVRGAIAEFSVSFQEAQSGLSQSFEQMNYQIDDYQKRLKSEREDYTEEKRSIDRNIENCEERKAEIERKRENSKSGSTDSFVCGCGVRTMLRVYGDTTTCKSCGGTMDRVYTGNDYNKFNAEAYQLEQKIVQLKKKSAELDRRIKELDEKEDDVLVRKTAFQNQQSSILALLSFESGEDPETATAFIDKALASLGEYNSTSFSTDLVSSTDGTKKKRI